MKRYLMLSVAIMTSSLVFAQHRGGEKRREDMSEKMKTELSLTEAQYASVKGINEKYHDRFVSIRRDSTTKESKLQMIRTLQKDREKEIDAVLTPDQKLKWASLTAEHKEKEHEHMKMAAEKYESGLKADLSLTDEQFSKVQSAGKSFREKLQAIHSMQDASEDVRKAEFEKARSDYEETMKNVLNPEQFQKWQKRKAEMKKRAGGPKHRG